MPSAARRGPSQSLRSYPGHPANREPGKRLSLAHESRRKSVLSSLGRVSIFSSNPMDPGAKPEPERSRVPLSSFSGSPEQLLRSQLAPPTHPQSLGRLGQYEVIEMIGAGGMGLVMRAQAPGGGAEVAIKLLRPELAFEPMAKRHFMREARHMKRLQHPHILPILEVGETTERPYFVMPLMQGENLGRLLREGTPLETSRILMIARQVGEAIAHAHRKGIIHRDIKPTNVLLDRDGTAKLADFGLARSVYNDSMIDPGVAQHAGTAAYMSPGVASGNAEDTRGDIYSFGAMLYEMLTGRAPYSGAHNKDIIERLKARPPRPILQVNPTAPRPLVAIAETAMARELRDRYASMQDLLADLELAAAGRDPQGVRMRPAVRRGAGALIGGGVLAAVCVSLWGVWPRVQGDADEAPSRSRADDGSASGLAPNSLPGELQLVNRITFADLLDWGAAKVGHPFGTNREAMLFVPRESKILAVSGRGNIAFAYPDPEAGPSLYLDHVHDLDGDGFDDLIGSWARTSALQTVVWNAQGHVVRRFSAVGAVRQGPGGWESDSVLRALAVTDLETDGKRELLAYLGTGYQKSPRELLCFDYDTQEVKWRMHLPASPTSLTVEQLNPGGGKVIVFGTGSIGNDYMTPEGLSDTNSYVGCLSPDGKLQWIHAVCSGNSGAFIATEDGDGDGYPEVWVRVNALYRHREGLPEREVGRVIQYDRDGRLMNSYDLGRSLIDWCWADLDGDASRELLLVDSQGQVQILNKKLEVQNACQLGSLRYTSFRATFGGVADLDGDGQPEIVMTCSQDEDIYVDNPGYREGPPTVIYRHDNEIVVLNTQLEVLARYTVSPLWQRGPNFAALVADMNGDRTPEVVALCDTVQVLSLSRR
jgi:hypothetical protein